MIANITRFENPIPKKTSNRLFDCFPLAASGDRRRSINGRSPPSGSARISSTRCIPCQKKRYGEIVVPKTAIRTAMNDLDTWKCGTIVLKEDAHPGYLDEEQHHAVGQERHAQKLQYVGGEPERPRDQVRDQNGASQQ